jgi:hypothetical protein
MQLFLLNVYMGRTAPETRIKEITAEEGLIERFIVMGICFYLRSTLCVVYLFIIWYEHSLCMDILCVTDFQRSSGYSIVHAPLAYLFRTLADVYIWVYLVSVIYILVQWPFTRLSCNVKILKY